MVPYITTAHVEAIGNVGVALAAGFAAWQGVKSLNAWRRERIGIRKIELAEEALIHIYQAENAFSAIRSPIGDSSESENREHSPDESPAQRHARDLAHAVWERMQKQQQVFENLYSTSIKVKAVFGAEAFEPFAIFRRCFGRVRVAAQMLFRTPYEGYNDRQFVQKLEADIWDMDGNEDSIEGQLKKAVASLEKTLGNHLRTH